MAAVAVIAVGAAFLIGSAVGGLRAEQGLTVSVVTPDQIAGAMTSDVYYSEYDGSTLLMHDTVAAVTNEDRQMIVQFRAAPGSQVSCQLDSGVAPPRTGQVITIAAEGAQAERLGDGVVLKHCKLVS